MKKSVKKYNFIIFFLIFILSTVSAGFFAQRILFPLSEYKSEIICAAKRYGLQPSLVFAIVRTESRFDKNAVSSKGAVGLMQLCTSTAKYVADMKGLTSYDLTDVKTNLDFGCFYFNYLLDKFNEKDVCLAAYNAGEGNVKNWLSDSKYSADGKTLDDIPLPETKEYVSRVNKSLRKYQNLYFNTLDK